MIFLIIIQFIVIILIQETILPEMGVIGSYLFKPLLWLSLFFTVLYFSRENGKNIFDIKRFKRWYLGNSPMHAGLMLGGFQISILILIGLFTSFGKSPYSFTPTSLGINMFFVLSFLIGSEFVRSYLINTPTISNKQVSMIIILTTLLFIVIEIPFQNIDILLFENPIKSLEFLGKTIITAVTINILACYLAYLGGAKASMSYMGVILLFQWFSPILPDPHWTLYALVGTVAPAIGYLMIQNSLTSRKIRRQIQRKQRKKQFGDSWTIVAIFSIIILFFSFGYLGVEPKIVYSGSMQPLYQIGDIVIIDTVDPDTLEIGDIIQYLSYDNHTRIIHRIIEINTTQHPTLYITKGDANENPDYKPITEQRILGKPIFTIPKLGWIQILIRSSMSNIGL